MSTDQKKWIQIDDPAAIFSNWAFTIKKAHWAAFGVGLREYTNQEKTEQLRDKWESKNPRYTELAKTLAGTTLKPAEKDIHPDIEEWRQLQVDRLRYKISYLAWAYSSPVAYAFEVGDIFHLATNESEVLQVVAGGDVLEVKHSRRHPDRFSIGYQATPEQLKKWLERGDIPNGVVQIHKNQSRSEIAKFYEYTG